LKDIPFRGVRFLKLRFNDNDAPKDFDILTKKGPLRMLKQVLFSSRHKKSEETKLLWTCQPMEPTSELEPEAPSLSGAILLDCQAKCNR